MEEAEEIKNVCVLPLFWEFKLFTWDVERKGAPDEIDKAIATTLNMCPQIVCLQQANTIERSKLTKNFQWFYSGDVGSAILVERSSQLEVTNFSQLCEHICIAEISAPHGFKLNVISCYIPPSGDYINEDLWMKLRETFKTIPSNMSVILAGNFNAEVGLKDVTNTDKIFFGPFLHHDSSNENGFTLMKLARMTHMRATSTLTFSAKPKRTEYFTHKDEDEKSQHDYIFVANLRETVPSSLISEWHPEYKHSLLGVKMHLKKMNNYFFGRETEEEWNQPKMLISTWNTQAATPGKVDSVLSEHNLPIICLQELFLTSEQEIKTDNYVWYNSKKSWAKNVGILIKKSPDISLSNFQYLSECLCVGDVVFHGKHAKVISCFLPLPNDPRNEVVKNQVTELVKSLPEKTFIVLAGDFNTELKEEDPNEDGDFDSNAKFLISLANDTKLCKTSSIINQFKIDRTKLISRITETSHGIPHDILISSSGRCKSCIKLFVRWIPFFNNAIYCSYLKHTGLSKSTGEGLPHSIFVFEDINPVSEEIEENKKGPGNYSILIRKCIINESEEEEEEDDDDDEKSRTLSAADLKSFSKNTPGFKNLNRLLNDFVIYSPVTSGSHILTSPIQVLRHSFRAGKFGKLEMDNIEEINDAGLKRRIGRIRWKGILLYEYTGSFDGKFSIDKKTAHNFLSKLSKIFPTIKAKRSYFNNGSAPMLMNDPGIAKVLKEVDKKMAPTMEDVLKYIKNFFSQGSDCELYFGSDFNDKELLEIKNYAKTEKLKYRFFTAPTEQKNLALSRKISPLTIRDKLWREPKDFRYYLVPACGIAKNPSNFYLKYMEKHFPDELNYVNLSRKRFGTSLETEEKSTPNAEIAQEPKNVQNTKSHVKGKPQRKAQNRNPKFTPGSSWNSRSKNFRNQQGTKRPPPAENFSWNYPPNRSQYEDIGFSGAPSFKQPRLEPPEMSQLPRVVQPVFQELAPILIVWPISSCSMEERNLSTVLEENYPTQFLMGYNGKVATIVTLPLRQGSERDYCLSVANGKNHAARQALECIVRFSTIIKPNPSYLCNGGVPNFIRYGVPCQANPRTYILLSYGETGPLTEGKVAELFDTFRASYNEDVYFDKHDYTASEKSTLLNLAGEFGLSARHFGEVSGLAGRYVCVSKKKSKDEILEEVLKMQGQHPKYTLTKDMLPAGPGFNVF